MSHRDRQSRTETVGNPFQKVPRPEEKEHENASGADPKVRSDNYEFPTRPEGKFAQAMSSVACNPVEGATGRIISNFDHLNDNFNEQVSQALAIKLNLKTVHHANEKALGLLLQSNTCNGELKQTLQARAAVYGSQLDPA